MSNRADNVLIEPLHYLLKNWLIFKRSIGGLNLEFIFSDTGCFNEAKKHSLPYYLHISMGVGGNKSIDKTSRGLARREMQTTSSRIWKRVTDSIP